MVYFNTLLRSLLQAVVQGLPSKRKLRILEVGAGSGGTTSALLPGLPPDRIEYIFSDVSELFLTRAEEKFRDYPFLRYSRLDLELDPQAQGFPAKHFDILIAANVLHATRNLPQALANVHSLLAPGGMLLAFEVTEPLAWFDVTTALIEGWGRFEDSLRSNTPLLSAPRWMDALQQAGFEHPVSFPEAWTPPCILGSHILMAHTPLDESPAKSDTLPILETVPIIASAQQSKEKEPDPRLEALLAALPGERRELLIDYLRQQLVQILRIANPEKLDRRQRLMDLGVDSLMALELKNRLQTRLNLNTKLPSTLIYDYPSIEAVAGYLEQVLFNPGSEPASPAEPSAPDPGGTGAVGLDDLSEGEIESLLLKKIKGIQA